MIRECTSIEIYIDDELYKEMKIKNNDAIQGFKEVEKMVETISVENPEKLVSICATTKNISKSVENFYYYKGGQYLDDKEAIIAKIEQIYKSKVSYSPGQDFIKLEIKEGFQLDNGSVTNHSFDIYEDVFKIEKVIAKIKNKEDIVFESKGDVDLFSKVAKFYFDEQINKKISLQKESEHTLE